MQSLVIFFYILASGFLTASWMYSNYNKYDVIADVVMSLSGSFTGVLVYHMVML